jgi:predicted transcriptional regulator
MAEQQRVSTRVGREVIETIEHVAEVERRPPSAVIRIALEDWAASRRTEGTRLHLDACSRILAGARQDDAGLGQLSRRIERRRESHLVRRKGGRHRR